MRMDNVRRDKYNQRCIDCDTTLSVDWASVNLVCMLHSRFFSFHSASCTDELIACFAWRWHRESSSA
jgi:hypothetical protein